MTDKVPDDLWRDFPKTAPAFEVRQHTRVHDPAWHNFRMRAVRPKHLQAYLDELVFRHNRRKTNGVGRIAARLIETLVNKPRLTMKALVKTTKPYRKPTPANPAPTRAKRKGMVRVTRRPRKTLSGRKPQIRSGRPAMLSRAPLASNPLESNTLDL